jgi:membrane associated rhomboid family serine protease
MSYLATMLPIGDRNPTRTSPVVNYCLLVANVLVFAIQLIATAGDGDAWVLPGYGLVPARFGADPAGEAFTLLTSMFMHGGLLHLGGNLLFLYIFGDNVEDAIGHLRYALFYLASGIGAAIAQVAVDADSRVPMIGASGAIAGVLAAYLVLFPRAPITVLVPPPFGFFLGFFIVVPAWVVMGGWFLVNLTSGFGTLGRASTGGVAFFAHIGGFLTGLLAIRPFHAGRERIVSDRWRGFRPPERAVPSRLGRRP